MFVTRASSALLVSVGVLTCVAYAAEPTPTAAPRATGTEGLWGDLAGADDTALTRAILTLSKNPADTVAFLKSHMRPVKADAKRVAALIADLESNQFAVRQRAFEELEYLGKYIQADLEKSQASAGTEAKQRLQQLLDRIPKPMKDAKAAPLAKPGVNAIQIQMVGGVRRVIVNGVPVEGPGNVGPVAIGPSAYWVRAERAIAILEDIGTPEAKAIVEELARGEPDALPTEKAKAALERWGKK